MRNATALTANASNARIASDIVTTNTNPVILAAPIAELAKACGHDAEQDFCKPYGDGFSSPLVLFGTLQYVESETDERRAPRGLRHRSAEQH
jgi:hypothetical protein